MADNTRVKKLARKLQAETGMRYTEALARVRLQGAAAPEKNTMENETEILLLGTHTLAPGEVHHFILNSQRVGFVRGLDIQAPNLSTLTVNAYHIAGMPQLVGQQSCLAELVVGSGKVRVALSSAQRVEVAITNHSHSPQEVAVWIHWEDHTVEAFGQFEKLFEQPDMVQTNQLNGLGSVVIPPRGIGELRDFSNYNMQVKKLQLEASSDGVLVDSIVIGGLPMLKGNKGMPLSTFKEATPIPPGTLILVGQETLVQLSNPTEREVVVSGGLAVDTLNPYRLQKFWEDTIIRAAVKQDKGPSVNAQVGQSEPWRAAQAGRIEVDIRPVAGHCLERLELTVVGSTAPFELLLNGVDLPCGWSESDEVDGSWDTIVHFKDGRVFGPDPDRTTALGTKWRASGPPVPVFDEATSVVVVQGEGVAAAKVFTAWRPVITP